MTSTIKVPSSVVPIDVSGQPFSRMSTFRRSLIHVDFFIRRKKKDKRRNTVAEGDTKDLKDVLHNIINEGHTFMPNLIFEEKVPKDEIDYYSKPPHENNKSNKIITEEKNNNSKETCTNPEFQKYVKKNNEPEVKNQIPDNDSGDAKLSLNNQQNSDANKISTVNKRKSIGHIPISTVSAAMSVAVKMRQLNGKNENHSLRDNWSYNPSDSESELHYNNEETEISGSFCKSRLKEMSSNPKFLNSKMPENKEIEESSGNISDNNGTQDDLTSNSTSAESDVFFISSDESDGELSDSFKHNYGSSLSLSTVSNGSLNSLLSQTGTELASSTGTLTSVGLSTPPPTTTCASVSDKEYEFQKKEKTPITLTASTKSSKKVKSSQKMSKALKNDTRKTTVENSKSIFTTLVNIKSQTKKQNKMKTSNSKLTKMQNKPHINMYGNSSPKSFKQLPLFIKDTSSPVIESKPRNHLQSFSPNQSRQESESEQESKLSDTTQSEYNVKSSNGATHYSNCIKNVEIQSRQEVPFKYSHKVIVTPIHRQTMSEPNNPTALCKKPLPRVNEDQKQNANDVFQQKCRFQFTDLNKKEAPLFCQQNKLQRPMTLQMEKSKSAARVLLDPEGRVIHSTKSLDRKPNHSLPGTCYVYNTRVNNQDRYSVNSGNANGNNRHTMYSRQNLSFQIQNNTTYFDNKKSKFSTNSTTNVTNTPITTISRINHESDLLEKVESLPDSGSSNKKGFSEGFCSSTATERQNNTLTTASGGVSRQILSHVRDCNAVKKQQQQSKVLTDSKFYQSIPTVISPDPNISGLPSNETMLTQHNVNLHSLNMEKLNMSPVGNSYNNLLANAYTPQRSPLSDESPKPQQTTMSTEDLFTVIHNCKKRMNIKTDSDISLASSSSCSSSSSYFHPVSSKSGLAETGFLSPRNPSVHFENSRDRRSWADFRPINSNERKSLASDRLGPTKPTSMHDFKMLLLQTRSNSQSLGPRKSAVEMLKVPSTQNKTIINSATCNNSPQSPVSISIQNPLSPEFIIYNGHSTVPFKRNNRARSSLQSRYTMYPPIFEDCSEDLENSHAGDNQNFSAKIMTSVEHVHKNSQSHHGKNSNSSENSTQKLSLWL